ASSGGSIMQGRRGRRGSTRRRRRQRRLLLRRRIRRCGGGCLFRRAVSGGLHVLIVPAPAEVPDERDAALREQRLRITQVLFGEQQRQLLVQHVLLAGCAGVELCVRTGEQLLVALENIRERLTLLTQVIDRREAVFDSLECGKHGVAVQGDILVIRG